jgi:hypothetical protein
MCTLLAAISTVAAWTVEKTKEPKCIERGARAVGYNLGFSGIDAAATAELAGWNTV